MKFILIAAIAAIACADVADEWHESTAPTSPTDLLEFNAEMDSPLVAIESPAGVPEHYTLLDFNADKFAELAHSLSLTNAVTIKNGFHGDDLELTQINSMKPGTKVVWVEKDGSEHSREPQHMLHLSGKVKGDSASTVVLNMSPKNSYGFIHTGSNKYWLESHPQAHAVLVDLSRANNPASDPILSELRKGFQPDEPDPGSHSMSLSSDANRMDQVQKFTPDEPKTESHSMNLVETLDDYHTTIYSAIECDKSCYDRITGEGFNDVERYLRAIMAATSAIYKRDFGRDVKISYMKIDKSQNAYGSHPSDLGGILNYYAQQYNRVKKKQGVCYDVTHLFTGSGSGGLAAKGSACQYTDNNGAVSTIFGKWKGESTSSASNWDLIVALHETGHNVGSPHTHSYNPPLDNCVACDPGVAERKGTCGGSDAKPVPRGDRRCVTGTIMSYCHLCGGNNNIDMRFSSSEIAVIKGVLSKNCGPLPGEKPKQCIDQHRDCGYWLQSSGAGFCAWNLNQPVQGPANEICCKTCEAAGGSSPQCRATSGQDTWYQPSFVCKDGSPNQCPGWRAHCNSGATVGGKPLSEFCAKTCGKC